MNRRICIFVCAILAAGAAVFAGVYFSVNTDESLEGDAFKGADEAGSTILEDKFMLEEQTDEIEEDIFHRRSLLAQQMYGGE